MNVLTEMSMPLYRGEYKRLVSEEDCQVVAKDAIKQLLERTMDVALQERIFQHVSEQGAGSDRRNGYCERDLLTSWGWINKIRVPRGRVSSITDVVLPRYQRRQPEFDAVVMSSFLFGHSTRKSRRFFTELLGEIWNKGSIQPPSALTKHSHFKDLLILNRNHIYHCVSSPLTENRWPFRI